MVAVLMTSIAGAEAIVVSTSLLVTAIDSPFGDTAVAEAVLVTPPALIAC